MIYLVMFLACSKCESRLPTRSDLVAHIDSSHYGRAGREGSEQAGNGNDVYPSVR